VSEAGPVLTALLVHPSAPVRQTAAQALERVADITVLDGLLTALDDPAATVRFSLVGALAHAGGDGHALSDAQRTQILSRLEDLILRDPDPGVRSRAASVLGEVGTPEVLPFLWQRVLTAEDSRVKDKAWAAVMAILVRTGNLELLGDWDQKLARANQSERRLQLLEAAADAWAKNDHVKAPVGAALELLVQAQLENGKWPAALPRLRDLLNRPATDAEMDKRLHLLLEVGRQALKEGNSAESLRVVREAQPFLTRNNKVAGEFEKLEKQAQEGP
ncbi:MAG: HEAT repeat domain-containing protein, partial [Planctomycetes bacterium]|nr:HEAT repeat domain-containing protein [Planctomycetota bacterium]